MARILAALLVFFSPVFMQAQVLQAIVVQQPIAGGGSYTVTGATVTGGTISCTSPVTSGATTTCTLAPDATHIAASASSDTCGGSLSGLTYTTGSVTSNCIVTPVFSVAGAPPIQSGTAGGSGGSTTNSQAFTTHVTSGNLAVFYAFDGTDATATVSSVVWTGGGANCGTITAAPASPATGSTRRMWAYYANVTASDCTGVRFTWGTSINSVVIFAEYAGMATSSPLDCDVVGTGTGTAITSGTCNTTNAHDTLIGGIFVTSSGGGTLSTSGAASTFTLEVNNASTSHRGLVDKNVTATGAQAALATYSSSQTYIDYLMAMKRAN